MNAKVMTGRLIKIKNRSWTYFKGQPQSGQIALIVVLALLSTSTVMAIGLGILTFNEVKKLNNVVKTAQSYYAAEGGAEDAIIRVKNHMSYLSSYTLSVGSSTAAVNITGPLDNLSIVSEGNTEGRVRKVAINLSASPSSTNVSFNYGVQVGDGGLFMEKTATIVGSVYSNGNITSSNNPSITGDAFAAGTSSIDGGSWPGQLLDIDGNARARVIREARIGGTARAYQFTDCQVGGIAYYQGSITNCAAGGGSILQTYSNLPSLPMPIAESQLDTWEQEAQAGGVINGPCPYQPPNGASLGPVKINCGLLIDDNQIINMTGAIWVVGDMTISNQSIIRLSSSFGDDSSHIIIDNPSNQLTSSRFIIQNDGQIQGSGDPDSYVMVVSRNESSESGGGK